MINAPKQSKYSLYIQLGGLLFIMAAISGIANRSELWKILAFWWFQIGLILLPGMAVLQIAPVEGTTKLENLLFSYSFGYVINIMLYFVVASGDISDIGCRWICLGITMISGFILYKKRSIQQEEKDIGEKYLWIIIVCTIFLIYFIAFSMKHVIPSFLGKNSWHSDLLYWIGDIVALKKDFPPVDFRTLSLNYSYHYFGALQLAFVSKATGLSAAEIALNYSYIQAVVMLGLSALSLVKRVLKRKKVILFTLFLLLFSTGWEKTTGVTFFWHIYQVPMAFNIAYSLEMIVFLLLLIQMTKGKCDHVNLFFLVAFLLICTGTKGPSGALVLLGIGIVCVNWLLKKEYKKALLYGLVSLLAFGIIYYLLLASGNSSYLERAVYEDPYKIGLHNTLIVNLKIIFWKTLKYFVNLILINPWIVVPAGLYILFVLLKRNIKIDDVAFLTMGAVGTILGYVLHYYGNSQIYFSLSALPFITILAGRGIELVAEINPLHGRERKYTTVIVTVIGTMGILATILCGNWKNSLQTYVIQGICHLCGKETDYEMVTQMMSYSEYEAYLWIMENTDRNSIFLSDRMLEEGVFCYIPGVFSERYIYRYLNEADLENGRKCFTGDSEILNLYKDKGVKYLIQNKLISSPKKLFPEEDATLVFENEEVYVYKLNEKVF